MEEVVFEGAYGLFISSRFWDAAKKELGNKNCLYMEYKSEESKRNFSYVCLLVLPSCGLSVNAPHALSQLFSYCK